MRGYPQIYPARLNHPTMVGWKAGGAPRAASMSFQGANQLHLAPGLLRSWGSAASSVPVKNVYLVHKVLPSEMEDRVDGVPAITIAPPRRIGRVEPHQHSPCRMQALGRRGAPNQSFRVRQRQRTPIHTRLTDSRLTHRRMRLRCTRKKREEGGEEDREGEGGSAPQLEERETGLSGAHVSVRAAGRSRKVGWHRATRSSCFTCSHNTKL